MNNERKIRVWCSIWLIIVCLSGNSVASSDSETVEFRSVGYEKAVSLKDMKAKLDAYKVSVYDPYYKKQKTYRAFRLNDVLKFGYPFDIKEDTVTFLAKDGYNPAMALNFRHQGGWLAFEDLSWKGGWEPRDGVADFGPLNLVWVEEHQRAEAGYPWPGKIIAIELRDYQSAYGHIVPKGVANDSPVMKGYELFQSRCLVCHSLNRLGGDKGPDLLAPQPIVAYRSKEFLTQFIKRPSVFRYSRMPDNPDLSVRDVQYLITYLEYLAR